MEFHGRRQRVPQRDMLRAMRPIQKPGRSRPNQRPVSGQNPPKGRR